MDEKKVREAIEALKITIDIGKQKIEYNKTFEPKNDNEHIEKSIECAKTAIEALEKQLPKRPRENGMSDGLIKKTKYYTCQTCGNCLLTEMMNERQNTNYCWDCGQRLDWSE